MLSCIVSAPLGAAWLPQWEIRSRSSSHCLSSSRRTTGCFLRVCLEGPLYRGSYPDYMDDLIKIKISFCLLCQVINRFNTSEQCPLRKPNSTPKAHLQVDFYSPSLQGWLSEEQHIEYNWEILPWDLLVAATVNWWKEEQVGWAPGTWCPCIHLMYPLTSPWGKSKVSEGSLPLYPIRDREDNTVW